MDARAPLMSAAMIAVSSFKKGLGTIQALCHSVGAVFNTHQSTINVVCMPVVLKLNTPKIRDRFDLAASYIAVQGGFDGSRADVQKSNESLAILRRLWMTSVSDNIIKDFVEMALQHP